jgi:hypothetical protein
MIDVQRQGMVLTRDADGRAVVVRGETSPQNRQNLVTLTTLTASIGSGLVPLYEGEYRQVAFEVAQRDRAREPPAPSLETAMAKPDALPASQPWEAIPPPRQPAPAPTPPLASSPAVRIQDEVAPLRQELDRWIALRQQAHQNCLAVARIADCRSGI